MTERGDRQSNDGVMKTGTEWIGRSIGENSDTMKQKLMKVNSVTCFEPELSPVLTHHVKFIVCSIWVRKAICRQVLGNSARNKVQGLRHNIHKR